MSFPMKTMWVPGLCLALAVGIFSAPKALEAQVALSVAAGAAPYDLAGTGTSATAAVRLEWPVWKAVDVQVGSGFFWYQTQGDDADAMLLPEAGVLLRAPGSVPLYVTVGGGYTYGVKGNPDNDPMLYAGVGFDIEDRGGWSVRPELRVRAIDPWVGTIADFTVGVRRRFGS